MLDPLFKGHCSYLSQVSSFNRCKRTYKTFILSTVWCYWKVSNVVQEIETIRTQGENRACSHPKGTAHSTRRGGEKQPEVETGLSIAQLMLLMLKAPLLTLSCFNCCSKPQTEWKDKMGQYPKLRMNLKKSFYWCSYLCMYNSVLALQHSNFQRLESCFILCCRTKLLPSFQKESNNTAKIYFVHIHRAEVITKPLNCYSN